MNSSSMGPFIEYMSINFKLFILVWIMFKFSTVNSTFSCSNLRILQKEDRAHNDLTWFIWSHWADSNTQSLVLDYKLLKMIPTWLAEMVHLLRTFWTGLQIRTSENPNWFLREYLKLYQTVMFFSFSQNPLEITWPSWWLDIILENNFPSHP